MYHKKTRPDMNKECPEKLDWEFVKWVWNYRKRSRMNTIKKLEQIRENQQVIIVKTRRQVDGLIENLEKKRNIYK